MEQILRGGFGLNSNFSKLNKNKGVLRCALLVTLKCGSHFKESWSYSTLSHLSNKKSLLLYLKPVQTIPKRDFGMFLLRAVKGVMKVRYLLLGGALSGGVTLQKTYDEWKNNLPDFKWLDGYLPSSEQWEEMRISVMGLKDKVKDNLEVDPRFKQLLNTKYQIYKKWFDDRLDKALEAADKSAALRSANKSNDLIKPNKKFNFPTKMVTEQSSKMLQLYKIFGENKGMRYYY